MDNVLEAATGFEPVIPVLQTGALVHLATRPSCLSFLCWCHAPRCTGAKVPQGYSLAG